MIVLGLGLSNEMLSIISAYGTAKLQEFKDGGLKKGKTFWVLGYILLSKSDSA